METLVCIKRVPNTGARAVLTEDKQSIDTSNLGYTLSPHEECGIEEAVRLVEDHGGESTAMTLGAAGADEQLRTAIAMGVDEAVLLESDGSDWRPSRVADALATSIEDREDDYDLLVFGNEAADAQNYQVGVRVADKLGLPVVSGIKDLEVEDGTAVAQREIPGGSEHYELDLPAVITVKEGLNEPRYPSMRARMQANKTEITQLEAEGTGVEGFEKLELVVPEEGASETEILGESPDAAPDVAEVLEELEVL
ncbi:MAG: electron transfer flavoprotein subunit beta/FixA family protein [Haloarculaceae archaeon]